jgi:hypothetical protein
MAKWDPPNRSYKEPESSQYDLGATVMRCPYDGGVVIRIGSSSWTARCNQCSRQFDGPTLRGLSVQPTSQFPVIPRIPPSGEQLIGNRPRANYQQPGTEKPAAHPDVANYPLKPPPSAIKPPTENYIQPGTENPEHNPLVASHYGIPKNEV